MVCLAISSRPPLESTLCSPQSLGQLESPRGGLGSQTMVGAPEKRLGALQPQGAAQMPGVSACLGQGSCQSENSVVEMDSGKASGAGDRQMGGTGGWWGDRKSEGGG